MNIRIFSIILLIIVTGSFLLLKNQSPHESITPVQTNTNQPLVNQEKMIQGTHYLFDLIDHEPEQLKRLLERAESLSKTATDGNEKSRIAMVIHGPDVEIFEKKNYNKNKELIDLAAKLDASDIIDFKVCQVTADSRGINESSFPSFMEMVPFAPDEIDRLEDEGYVEL